MEEEGLGWGFWLKLMGGVLLVGLAIWVIFLVVGVAWAAWGAFGTMIFFIGVLLLIGVHLRQTPASLSVPGPIAALSAALGSRVRARR